MFTIDHFFKRKVASFFLFSKEGKIIYPPPKNISNIYYFIYLELSFIFLFFYFFLNFPISFSHKFPFPNQNQNHKSFQLQIQPLQFLHLDTFFFILFFFFLFLSCFITVQSPFFLFHDGRSWSILGFSLHEERSSSDFTEDGFSRRRFLSSSILPSSTAI